MSNYSERRHDEAIERIHHEVLLASTPTLVLTEGKNGSWHYLSIKLDKLKGKPVKGDGYDPML